MINENTDNLRLKLTQLPCPLALIHPALLLVGPYLHQYPEDDGTAFCQAFVNEAELQCELQLEILRLVLHWSRSQTTGSGNEASLAHAHSSTSGRGRITSGRGNDLYEGLARSSDSVVLSV